ncbi:MAG: ferredoxin [Candidatus Shikimatogenerans sp. Tser]|uniref:Ferredoxin n=1 Tax=Candidatus Shikimatogenerans sp. Tser TaxID=3158568 RepID=A0AAU7QSY7_9FLAO
MRRIYKIIFFTRNKCIGCGNCMLYNKYFIMSKKDGKAVLLNSKKKKKNYVKKIYKKNINFLNKICPIKIIKII